MEEEEITMMAITGIVDMEEGEEQEEEETSQLSTLPYTETIFLFPITLKFVQSDKENSTGGKTGQSC